MNTAPVLAAATAPAPRLLALSLVLIFIAGLEALDGLANVSMLFGDMSDIPGPGFGGFLIKAHVATHPVFALAALAFAAIGRVRYSIIALAVVVVMTWLNYMPSVVRHGLEFGGMAAFETPLQIIAFPLMAACGVALAARNQRPWLATVLVSIPTLFKVLGVVAFAIGVAIYGF